MSGQSQGVLAQLSLPGGAYCFGHIIDESSIGLVDGNRNSICGTYEKSAGRVAPGLKMFRWKVHLEPTPNELQGLFSYLGFAESPAGTFTVTDDYSALSFTMAIDGVAKVHTFTDCFIGLAEFVGQKGNDPVGLDLEIYGGDESEGAAGSFAAASVIDDVVYAFYNGVLTLEGAVREMDRFKIVIDNHPAQQFNNSRVATSTCPTDRSIYLAANVPYIAANTDLYTIPSINADVSGAVGSVAFTRSDVGKSTTFTFGNLKPIARRPGPIRKEEIRLPVTYGAYKDGATPSLVIVHDSVT